MMTFMEDFVTVAMFLVIVFVITLIVILAAIEAYDRITGADKRRQAQIHRLQQLEEEDF